MADGVTHLILFGAAVILAGVVSGVVFTAVTGIANDLHLRGAGLGGDLLTDVEIVNDPANVAVNPIKVYVKNTGSRTLNPDDLTVLLDGTYKAFTSSVLEGGDWSATKVAELSVAENPAAGDHVLRVIAPSGDAEELRFNV